VVFKVGQSRIFLHDSTPIDVRKSRKFSMKRFSIPLKRKKSNKKAFAESTLFTYPPEKALSFFAEK
jgi:hypothetical protein